MTAWPAVAVPVVVSAMAGTAGAEGRAGRGEELSAGPAPCCLLQTWPFPHSPVRNKYSFLVDCTESTRPSLLDTSDRTKPIKAQGSGWLPLGKELKGN